MAIKQCSFCGSEVINPREIGRRDTCPSCERDLHTCLQCRFYDLRSHHECGEPQAEYVKEKDSANFCGYFELFGQIRPELTGECAAGKNATRALDELFKKK